MVERWSVETWEEVGRWFFDGFEMDLLETGGLKIRRQPLLGGGSSSQRLLPLPTFSNPCHLLAGIGEGWVDVNGPSQNSATSNFVHLNHAMVLAKEGEQPMLSRCYQGASLSLPRPKPR